MKSDVNQKLYDIRFMYHEAKNLIERNKDSALIPGINLLQDSVEIFFTISDTRFRYNSKT